MKDSRLYVRSGMGRVGWFAAGALGLLHFCFARFITVAWGVRIDSIEKFGNWDAFWQAIPRSLLENDLWRSIWFLHAQPPLFNLFAAAVFSIFGDEYRPAIQLLYQIAGAAIVAMVYAVIVAHTRRHAVALMAALLLAFSPSLLLYESYLLYSVPSALLVVSAGFFLSLFRSCRQDRFLFLFLLCINLLVLTRGLYHVVLVAGALGLVLLLGRRRTALFFSCALISSVTVGWYVKNQALFGFFGASSWFGMNLWNIAARDYAPEELRAFVLAGTIPELVTVDDVTRPSAFRPYFQLLESEVPLLQLDNLHNLNVIEISRIYGRSARALIVHDPPRYLRAALAGYVLYSTPAWEYRDLAANRERLGALVEFYRSLTRGELFTALGLPSAAPLGSLLFFVLPLLLVVMFFRLATAAPRSGSGLGAVLRAEPALVYFFSVTIYVTASSTLLDLGENTRFFFDIGAVVLILAACALSPWVMSADND